ncbi:MAG TPA: KipI antagonist, partial [Firmicutes bacterium]|nr:KipI antagonist [Bacillota bacterium]
EGSAIVPIEPDIISDAIAFGSIQVPRSGQPIIMGPDRQTTGGYPKIGTVITPDLRLLAQALPGDSLRLQAITIDEAQQQVAGYAAGLKKLQQLVDNKIRGQNLRVQIGEYEYYSFVEEVSEFR